MVLPEGLVDGVVVCPTPSLSPPSLQDVLSETVRYYSAASALKSAFATTPTVAEAPGSSSSESVAVAEPPAAGGSAESGEPRGSDVKGEQGDATA